MLLGHTHLTRLTTPTPLSSHTHLNKVDIYLKYGGQLTDTGVLIDGDKYLVEEGFKVVALDAVHDKALEGRNNYDVIVSDGDLKVD